MDKWRLSPCPFCGEAMKLKLWGLMEDFYIQCGTCTTTGPNGFDEECAVIQWNNREGANVEQKPSIGRIVHYQRYGSPGGEHKPEPSPAVIVKVNNEETMECQLFVMNPNGMYFNPTPFSTEPKPGHWNWPPRVSS